MNSKLVAAVSLLIALGMGVMFSRTRAQLSLSRAEADAYRATNANLSERITILESNKVSPAELERLRVDQREAIRLRGEVTRLKQEASAPRAAISNGNNRAAAEGANQNPESVEAPVRTFTLQARGAVPPGSTMTVGGWETSPGVHTFALLTPEIINGQISIQARLVEGPRDVVQTLNNFGESVSRGSRLLTAEQSAAFMAALDQTENVNLLAAPSVITFPGQPANISVGSQMQGPDGTMIHLGPEITITPVLGADSSIDLSASARVTVPKPAPSR